VRERETETGLAYIWSGAIQYVAGFGIGTYTFRVLYWVIGIALLGAIYLRTRVQGVRDKNHGFIWCFGASLSRLLPVIEINEDFKKFFNDPNRAMLTNLQSLIFSTMGVVGWVLGAILVAAISGLTQSSRRRCVSPTSSAFDGVPRLASRRLVCSFFMLQMTACGAERKCWHVSLPAAIGGNAENICSPRVLLTVTHSGHSKCASGASGTDRQWTYTREVWCYSWVRPPSTATSLPVM
jgi:hypothetical protein